MTKNNYPSWTSRLTVGVALPKIDSSLHAELLPHKDTVVSLVWRRISRAARIALTQWGKPYET